MGKRSAVAHKPVAGITAQYGVNGWVPLAQNGCMRSPNSVGSLLRAAQSTSIRRMCSLWAMAHCHGNLSALQVIQVVVHLSLIPGPSMQHPNRAIVRP